MKAFLYLLRRHLPRSLRRQIHRAGEFFGDEFCDRSAQFGADSSPSVSSTLKCLRSWGVEPRTVVDVGAFRGEWTRLVKALFPGCRLLMVEAQEKLRPVLTDVCSYYSDVSYEPALLGATAGVRVEFVEMATGSSVYEEKSPVPRQVVPKETATLDALVRARGWETIDLLKLDVQGYELEVLKGATHYLPTCEFVLLECSLIPINRGCPLIADVFAFMTPRGFRLFDVCSQIRRKDGALWQTDLVFINEKSRHVPAPELNATNW